MFYGAAEFTRELDLLVLCEPGNLNRLRAALTELEAELIAVPAFDEVFLRRGHVVHFQCKREDVAGLRINVSSRLRGMSEFEELWDRHTVVEIEGIAIYLPGLEDLVCAKKTDRVEDWSMIRLLLESNYFRLGDPGFWLRELRTPELLIEAAAAHKELAQTIATHRPAVAAALTGDWNAVDDALKAEQEEERRKDKLWWQPLRAELEQFRHAKLKSPSGDSLQ